MVFKTFLMVEQAKQHLLWFSKSCCFRKIFQHSVKNRQNINALSYSRKTILSAQEAFNAQDDRLSSVYKVKIEGHINTIAQKFIQSGKNQKKNTIAGQFLGYPCGLCSQPQQNNKISQQTQEMDFFFTEEFTQSKEDEQWQARRRFARELYESYAGTNRNFNCQPGDREVSNNSLKNRQSRKIDKGLSEEDSLVLLEALFDGKSIPQIHEEYDLFRQYERKKLHNFYRCALARLSKTFVEVLPKTMCELTTQQFQQKYFKSASLLPNYRQNGINLPEVFEKLVFIRTWQKQYKDYLERGYGKDYLPESVVTILEQVPEHFQNINYVYELSHATTSMKNKVTETPTTHGSGRTEDVIEIDFSQ